MVALGAGFLRVVGAFVAAGDDVEVVRCIALGEGAGSFVIGV